MRLPDDDRSSFKRKDNPFGARMAAMAVVGALVIAAVLTLAPGPALAAATVRGQPANMQLHTENATIREVLNALSSAFKLTYKLPPNVGRQVSGLYTGTLHQVLTRVLDGNDYIVKVSDAGVEVVVLGESGKTAIAPIGRAASPAGPVITASENAAAPQAAAPNAVPPLTSFR